MTDGDERDRLEEAERRAGARFDSVMARLKDAWAKQYPSEPFEVDGVVTPLAMAFINGYGAGVEAIEDAER